MFGFKSITHRLIFGCAVAAVVIYSLSYLQMRALVQKTLMVWIKHLSQSHIDRTAKEIEEIVRSLSTNTQILTQKIPDSNQYLESIPPLVQNLLEQQSQIKSVAVAWLPNSTNTPLGFSYNRQQKQTNLSAIALNSVLTHCPINNTTTQPFWSQTHSIIYCVPFRRRETLGVVAVELSSDWLIPLIRQKPNLKDGINQTDIGDPFLISLSTREWIVSPVKPDQVMSFLSSQALDSNQPTQDVLISTTLPSLPWKMGILFSNSELQTLQNKYFVLITISMTKDMLLMFLVIVLVSRHTTRPLRALISSTEDMAAGNLDTTLSPVTIRDEVGRLAIAFRLLRDSLKAHIEKLQHTTAAKQKLESELAIASQIQRTMLPKINVSHLPNQRYQISALLQPARMVGGDLYDFFSLDSDRLCIIIGDVADKGVPAALLMAQTITLIRTIAKPTTINPTEILDSVNLALCRDNEECLFVTLFCGIINLNNGTILYASGGHDAPLLIRNGQVQLLESETGPPLGLYDDAVFPQAKHLLTNNDIIVLYTDGITEAMNPQGELFSEAYLIHTITNHPPTNPARAIRTIQHFHQQFIADAPQSDDMTILSLQYLPSNPFSQEIKVVEQIITINSELTELEQVKQRISEILESESLLLELIEDAQLIVEEVLVNIIQHGYENRHDQAIDLRVKISDKTLSMSFEDGGKPFNPLLEINLLNREVETDEISVGGLGLYLVQKLSDHIEYEYSNGKNLLTVYRNITKTF
ncbi:SpoIIE family protein phosphatase [Cronbergia sp. UHCC 0137]|uniref:SpoIIE family protein phosphatase n=1 Tax=Cronbergia sp. UHCC 0137 TaxID=3110239 RepID=UPI002B21960F|nr:SpoIIE family protein phosphatase [Cronbergia sp. UHCC 0137]MEA5619118.1 SpoIIE family protein phosphatase [Cronbergia sp. UHCC 0137]